MSLLFSFDSWPQSLVIIREVKATAARTVTNEIHDALSCDGLRVTVEVKVDICNNIAIT